jgi:signal transduction histidine kinase/HPt (histidine-containing phosphotransfer) domain-containing protein
MDKAVIRVLLVDDDEDERLIVAGLLRVAGAEKFALTWLPTYEQGLAAIRARSCDVCLVDYRLGQRSGLDLLAEVTAEPGHPQVILMTGGGDRDVDLTAAKSGAADYLVKGELTAALLERSIRYALERGRTLQALRDASQSQSLNLAKSAFLAAMSHEMRTPMNSILGMADILWESPLSSEQMKYLEVLRRSGSGLLVLINDILDLSKIESGHLELERVEFDLAEIVDQVIELMAVTASSKGLVLLSHLSPAIPTGLMGDPNRLGQILINLLANAIKFTASGEIVLTVANHQSANLSELEFAVSDTGIGIPYDKLETIFADFTQADASTTRKYGGTGLGLGISRRLVEAMGGKLTVASSVGQGSTFRFRVAFDPAPERGQRVELAPAPLRAKRVLLLDDNSASRLILWETLEAWGLESSTPPSPAAAITLLREAMESSEPYSLAVIAADGIDGMDGFALAAEMAQMAPDLPIVLLLSNAQPDDSARCAKAGLAGWAVRPVARAHFLRMVCEAMETRAVPLPLSAATPPLSDLDPSETDVTPLASILVVDDSPDNRLLIHAYLTCSPYQVTFEEDGQAALDRFAIARFDLILMDVQMPVMDGLTATRAIRALEQKRGSAAVPILALTAHTAFEDMHRCVTAGCNAHLSKPISKGDLITAIEKHLRLKSPESKPSGRIPMPAGVEELVPSYLARRRQEVPEMLELLAHSDFARLASLGHDLKGSGGGYGFPELTRLGAALEEFANQKDGPACGTKMTELVDYLALCN